MSGFYGGTPLPDKDESQGEDPLAKDILGPQGAPEGMVMPDLIQKVIGFRSWDIQNGHKLAAGFGVWVPGENTAECAGRAQHNPPEAICGCGLYAFHSIKKTKHWHYGDVVGAITAWGRLRVATTGFRAEKAEIIAISARKLSASDVLNAEGDLYDTLDPVATYYGVPIISFDELEDYALNCGEGGPVPLDLYPKDKVWKAAPPKAVKKKAKQTSSTSASSAGGGGASPGPAYHYQKADLSPEGLFRAFIIFWVVVAILVLAANGMRAA